MARFVNRGEKPPDVFSQNQGPNRYNRYFYLRVGRILEVDYDRNRMKIEWITGAGSPPWVPISYPYVGPGGCIGMSPEIYSLGIFGYYDEGTGKGAPFCLAYLPSGLAAGEEYNLVKNNPDSITTEDPNVIPHKFRKLYDGDLIISSHLGGEIFINRDVNINDTSGDALNIRGSDQSIIATSLNNFVFADGASVSAGPIIRNGIVLFDENGQRIPNILAREATLPDGRSQIYVVPFGGRIEYDSQYYCEYRIDADEICDGTLDYNEINSQSSLSERNPIITLAMGNYVGAQEADSRYGKILRPVLFNAPDDKVGQFSLIECVQNKGQDEVTSLGMAYALHHLRSDSFIGLDKEGHYYMYLASSASNPLGAGRSMSLLAVGSKKEVWGADTNEGNSWDLSTKGGVKWDIGEHNLKANGRSIDITTSRGVKFQIRGNDEEGYARQDEILGNSRKIIANNENTEVGGESTLIVDGLRSEQIRGSAAYDYQVDKSEQVLGVYTQTVVKEMQGRFGKRKTTITAGNDELTVVAGNIEETIQTFGSRKTTIFGPGNIEEFLTAGNRSTTIQAGKFEVVVTTGGIELKTLAGTVRLSGSVSVNIESLGVATMKALQVNLGNGPRGGVVTGLPGIPSHLDYVTGLPLKGSVTVNAGP